MIERQDGAIHPGDLRGSVKRSLDGVLRWSEKSDFAGYSKFDLFNSPIIDRLTPRIPLVRALMSAAWARSPVNLRPLLGSTESRNPKGIALFAMAYLRRYRLDGASEDLERAVRLLTWLKDNAVEAYSGACWGYDHEWNNLHFTAPKYSPNIVVTGNVAYAMLDAFEVTGDSWFLDIARSTVDFFLHDLEYTVDTPDERNISYVPGYTWSVLNITGLAAVIMAKVAKLTEEQHLLDTARRLVTFLVRRQTDYGAWHYAWPSSTSNVKHDNYHTGNVLDWILEYTVVTGDDEFRDSLGRGIAFYRDHLFCPDVLPKWRHNRRYPADVHSAAQGVVTFAKAAMSVDRSFMEYAWRVAGWAVENLQHEDGWFFYQKGPLLTKKYTLMRWCNAWMSFALASLLVAEETAQQSHQTNHPSNEPATE
jgi:hypothetical protein